MSDTKLDTLKATRPASRWRNKYLTLRRHREPNGEVFLPGQESVSPRLWPCRDSAETYGKTWEAEFGYYAKYLGAFPVDA